MSLKKDVFTRARVRILALYLGTGALITATTIEVINTQAWQIDALVGLLIFMLLGIYTYTLVRATLWPIQKTTDRQRRFSGNVAHELRTPLAAMKTKFEVALMGANGQAAGEIKELSDALQSGIEEIDRMSAITKFLLTFSASDIHQVELEFSDVDLAAIIDETVRRMQPFTDSRSITVRTVNSSPAMVRGNAVTLSELLVNIMKNAIAYTPTGGSVVIAAPKKRGFVTLSISDTGIGIPAKDLPNIFEPFYRGENAYSERSKKRGSGIGLAIVKEIVELHKAHISVESELGKGTTFSIRFPAA